MLNPFQLGISSRAIWVALHSCSHLYWSIPKKDYKVIDTLHCIGSPHLNETSWTHSNKLCICYTRPIFELAQFTQLWMIKSGLWSNDVRSQNGNQGSHLILLILWRFKFCETELASFNTDWSVSFLMESVFKLQVCTTFHWQYISIITSNEKVNLKTVR